MAEEGRERFIKRYSSLDPYLEAAKTKVEVKEYFIEKPKPQPSIRSFTRGKIYSFKGLDNIIKSGKWVGIKEWKGQTAIMIFQDLQEESRKYYVPDNLVIAEIEPKGKWEITKTAYLPEKPVREEVYEGSISEAQTKAVNAMREELKRHDGWVERSYYAPDYSEFYIEYRIPHLGTKVLKKTFTREVKPDGHYRWIFRW